MDRVCFQTYNLKQGYWLLYYTPEQQHWQSPAETATSAQPETSAEDDKRLP